MPLQSLMQAGQGLNTSGLQGSHTTSQPGCSLLTCAHPALIRCCWWSVPRPVSQVAGSAVQVGCAMNCQFCLTGRMGLRGNLTTAQIVEQV